MFNFTHLFTPNETAVICKSLCMNFNNKSTAITNAIASATPTPGSADDLILGLSTSETLILLNLIITSLLPLIHLLLKRLRRCSLCGSGAEADFEDASDIQSNSQVPVRAPSFQFHPRPGDLSLNSNGPRSQTIYSKPPEE